MFSHGGVCPHLQYLIFGNLMQSCKCVCKHQRYYCHGTNFLCLGTCSVKSDIKPTWVWAEGINFSTTVWSRALGEIRLLYWWTTFSWPDFSLKTFLWTSGAPGFHAVLVLSILLHAGQNLIFWPQIGTKTYFVDCRTWELLLPRATALIHS